MGLEQCWPTEWTGSLSCGGGATGGGGASSKLLH